MANKKTSNSNTKKKNSGKANPKLAEFKEDRYEIRLSGAGGQGLITAGVILADAIAVGDARNAAQTQSYGPEARGGHTRCDVIVSDGEISFPEAIELDLLLSLTQDAVDVYIPLLKTCGLLIIDADAVKRKPDRAYVEASFTQAAKETLGSTIATNIVSLGFISEYNHIVSKKSLEAAVVSNFPEKFAKKNLDALKLGYSLAKEAKRQSHSNTCVDDFATEIDRT